MARFLCESGYRTQIGHLFAANDCNFVHARRRNSSSRVYCPVETCGARLQVRSELDLGQRFYAIAVGDDGRKRVQRTVRMCVARKHCSLAASGGSRAAATAGLGEDATVSQNELLRPPELHVESDYSRNLRHSGGTLRNLKGQTLKTRLHDIIKDHKVFPYIQVWDALKVLDEAKDDPTSVIDIYSLKEVAKSLQARTDGWNREHLWPRSYGLVMGRPEFTDLQNLRPSDVNVNSSRGNKFFGDCTTSLSNQCLVPANKEAAPDTGANKDIWMPPAQVRGDIARALMYMAVRYGSEQPAGSQELQLSDSPSVENARMGRLSDLLHWNDVDPPSDVEKLRNSRVCSLYQHNRNPFVDHPEYANLIWGVTNTPSTQKLRTAAEPMEEESTALMKNSTMTVKVFHDVSAISIFALFPLSANLDFFC